MNKEQLKKLGFATQAIHGGHQPNQFGSLCDPIYQTFALHSKLQNKVDLVCTSEEDGYIYSRLGIRQTIWLKKSSLIRRWRSVCFGRPGIGAITSAIWVCVARRSYCIC